MIGLDTNVLMRYLAQELGYGDEAGLFGRLPRLPFDEAADLV